MVGGGSAHGAYEIGVLKALLEKDPDFAPDIITGTSAGAFNGAVLTAQALEHDHARDGCVITPG